MINIKKFYEKREIVCKIIELMKKNKLNDMQKKVVYDLVMNLTKKTDLQKEKFNMYFGLGLYNKDRKNMTEISRIYNVRSSAISESIRSIKFGMYHLSSESIEILENILEECREA